jgi:hypothetical protein
MSRSVYSNLDFCRLLRYRENALVTSPILLSSRHRITGTAFEYDAQQVWTYKITRTFRGPR